MEKTTVLGIPITVISFQEAVRQVFQWLSEDRMRMIFTPNPEFLVAARQDRDFAAILKEGDLVAADGVGIQLASKLNKIKIDERVPGCDLIQAVLNKMSKSGEGYSLYLFGGKPGVAARAAERIMKDYPGVTIAGISDGYFDRNKERKILREIQETRPDFLLVGLGFPKQEKWIYANRKRLPVKAAIGCGGSIDILAGEVKRAPEAFRKRGLEWLYRLLSQPSRFFRMLNLPKFLLLVMANKIRMVFTWKKK